MKGINKKIFIVILFSILFLVNTGFKLVRESSKPINAYIVYLNGKKIGLIKDKQELLDLIDSRQEKIKKQFDVKKVYPPEGLSIKYYTTFDNDFDTAQNVYQKIEKLSSFTIKGYVLSIKPDKGPAKTVNVLNKEDIKPALTSALEAFIPESSFKAYLNGTQPEIKETGKTIENVYFDEKITEKEAYLDVDDLIITNKDDLTKYLLFGTLKKQAEYTVKDGDNIETVAYNNKLSTEELLIANPSLASKDSLLSAGQILNIGLISPLFTVVEESEVVEDVETNFDTVYEDDANLYASQSYVKNEGQKGVTRLTEKVQYKNGDIVNLVTPYQQVLSAPQNKVIVRGTKQTTSYSLSAFPPAASGTSWGWPTSSPYTITSQFKWRWGRLHAGIDISVGMGAPIYSATDGTVIKTNTGCSNNPNASCGGGYGNYVHIKATNGYYVIYGHMMNNIVVRAGQNVTKGQLLGYMGNSGSSTGTHLHFQINTTDYFGEKAGISQNPCEVAFSC